MAAYNLFSGDSAGTLPHGVTSRNGKVYVSYGTGSNDVASEYNELRMITVADDAANVQTVWTMDNPRYQRQSVVSSIAVDAEDKHWIVHGAPSGLVLRRALPDPQLPEQAAEILLAQEAPLFEDPLLLFDAAGEPHVFYAVIERSPSDMKVILRSELRHVHRGTCP